MKIAIYSRKSVETDKGESIKNQIEMCKEYFLRRETNVNFEIFQDEGFSGGNINRPSFQLMINRAKNKEFDVIACYKIDRIARNIVDFVNIYSELEKLDIKLVSVTEGFDPSTPLGKLIMMILASFAEMERANIQQRVKDNMRELAKKGKWTGGKVPFGYSTERVEKNSKKATYLKLDDTKVKIIEEIYNYYIDTQSMHQVQKWLYNNKGIKWCLSTIKNILTSPVYVKADIKIIKYLKNFGEVFGEPNENTGLITYNRRPYTNGKHRWNDKDMFYSVSTHTGIIEPQKWLVVQNIQEKSKTSPRPKSSQISYLTGTLKCAKCGSPITISYNHKNKDGSITYVYVCTGRKAYGKKFCDCKQIKQSILDYEFENALSNYLKIDKVEFLNMIHKEDTSNVKTKITTLEKRINTNINKINNLVDKLMLLSNDAGMPLTNKIEELTKENEELKRELIFLHQEQLNNKIIDPEIIYNNLKNIVHILNSRSIDIDTKKTAMQSAINEVQYYKYDTDNIELTIDFL